MRLQLRSVILFWGMLLGIILLAAIPVQCATTNGWEAQTSHTSVDLNAVDFINSTQGWAVGNSGKFINTSDGGQTWTEHTIGSVTADFYKVDFINATTGWIVGSNCIEKTINGGATWIDQTPGGSSGLLSLSVVNADTIFVGGIDGIWNSTTGGNSWNLSPTASRHFKDIQFNDAKTGWEVEGNWAGSISSYTVDGGASWNDASTLMIHCNAIQMVNLLTGWVIGTPSMNLGTSYSIARTVDGGHSWSDQTPDTSSIYPLYDLHFVDTTHGWVVGATGTIFATTDGTHWIIQTRLVSDSLYGVKFVDANNGWAVGSGGTVIHTSNGGVYTSGTVPGGIPGFGVDLIVLVSVASILAIRQKMRRHLQ